MCSEFEALPLESLAGGDAVEIISDFETKLSGGGEMKTRVPDGPKLARGDVPVRVTAPAGKCTLCKQDGIAASVHHQVSSGFNSHHTSLKRQLWEFVQRASKLSGVSWRCQRRSLSMPCDPRRPRPASPGAATLPVAAHWLHFPSGDLNYQYSGIKPPVDLAACGIIVLSRFPLQRHLHVNY